MKLFVSRKDGTVVQPGELDVRIGANTTDGDVEFPEFGSIEEAYEVAGKPDPDNEDWVFDQHPRVYIGDYEIGIYEEDDDLAETKGGDHAACVPRARVEGLLDEWHRYCCEATESAERMGPCREAAELLSVRNGVKLCAEQLRALLEPGEGQGA